MKKFLMMGLMALGIAAASQQQASAWIKFNISAGFNISFESGNNTWLWGAFHNGPYMGGYPDFGHGFHGDYGYPMGYDYGGFYGGHAAATPRSALR